MIKGGERIGRGGVWLDASFNTFAIGIGSGFYSLVMTERRYASRISSLLKHPSGHCSGNQMKLTANQLSGCGPRMFRWHHCLPVHKYTGIEVLVTETWSVLKWVAKFRQRVPTDCQLPSNPIKEIEYST